MTDRFTSDTHFNHTNIIGYCNRPFKDVSQMNEAIIEAWNLVVKPDDTTYHLGDFAMGDKSKIPGIRKQLNGRIVLILGNHDRGAQFMLDSGFDEVHKFLIYNTGEFEIYLSHHPQNEFNSPGPILPPVKYAFHGHNHGIYKRNGLLYDVGVDAIGFTPKTVEQIIENG
jgi:calcineurin-like phosphoesterase family protein